MSAIPPVPTGTFDFSNVAVTWGDFSLNGGLVSIKVARAEDAWSYHVASDGTVTRVANNNKMGTVTLVYGQNAPILDVLSQQAQLDEATGTAKFPIEVIDGSGRSIARAPFAWIKKVPDVEYGKEGTTREVVLDCDQLIHFVGGIN
jgi:hypothetical protein